VETVTAKLLEMGCEVEVADDSITVISDGHLKATNVRALPYPGFPTDMQPQFGALLCLAEGVGTIEEDVWLNRYRYADELVKMGAEVIVSAQKATFIGGKKLHGARVQAVDLRGGAAAVIAGLAASGKTEVTNIELIQRGYCDIVGKLKAVGADIEMVVVAESADEVVVTV
jgi:UDP-N-acetylglucosamine 1-carboxyvinyltransferase